LHQAHGRGRLEKACFAALTGPTIVVRLTGVKPRCDDGSFPPARRRLGCGLLWLAAMWAGLGCEPSPVTVTTDAWSEPEADGFDAPDAETDSGTDGEADPEADGETGELHVLFIGNSYTYANDLPGMLTRIASTAGAGPAILTDQVVEAGATLHRHWNVGVAQARIDERTWTHVVLQGQSQEAGSDDFYQFAGQFGDLILGADAQPTLFVTWARAPEDPTYGSVWYGSEVSQDLITAAYATVAGRLPGSILSCVGEAFRGSLSRHPEIVLHQSDYSHPTVAGTYLAASTFYVALTGDPVPPESAVPAGLSPQEAEALREEALVGADCSLVRARGELVFPECMLPVGCSAFDFGVAGIPIPFIFAVRNAGWDTVGMQDGLTLGPPFGWTSGAYPGGSGAANAFGLQFCSTSLPPGEDCALSVSYLGTADGSAALTIDVSGGYDATAVRELRGSSTTRALLTISPMPGFCQLGYEGCVYTDFSATAWSIDGAPAPLSLVVTNRGAAPTTSLGVGTPLSPPFYWGPSGTHGVFPGGSGAGEVDGVTMDYCATQALGPGRQCMVTVVFEPPEDDTPTVSALDLAYADAEGSLPNATCELLGAEGFPDKWAPGEG